MAVEQTVARICREAGARVRNNVRLRDLNVAVPAADERHIEVIASGLASFGGQQLAIDVTVRGVLDRRGEPRSQAHWKDGVTAETARRDKERAYPELVSGGRCRLVVLAIELGGRFSKETAEFLESLALSKAESEPRHLRGPTAAAFLRRWSRMLAVSVASAHAWSLLSDKSALAGDAAAMGKMPWLQDVIIEACRFS